MNNVKLSEKMNEKQMLEVVLQHKSQDINVETFRQAYIAYNALLVDIEVGSETAAEDTFAITIGSNTYSVRACSAETVSAIFELLTTVMHDACDELLYQDHREENTAETTLNLYSDDERQKIYNDWCAHQADYGQVPPKYAYSAYTDETFAMWKKVLDN